MQQLQFKYAIFASLALIITVCFGCTLLSTSAECAATNAYPLSVAKHATAIASMKRLPDGAPVQVNNKVVTCILLEQIYIEEADRSAGIRVLSGDYYLPLYISPGNIVSFSGIMGTYSGERVVIIQSDFVYDTQVFTQIDPLGMSSAAILGWPARPFNQSNPVYRIGLEPVGLRVRVWGKIAEYSELDEDGWYAYLDDGSGKSDGVDYGIRIYSNYFPMPGQDILAVTGILSRKQIDPTPFSPDSGDEFLIPAIRVTAAEDIYQPNFPPTARQTAPVSGIISLAGQDGQGIPVRIYSQSNSVVINDVTDTGKPFTISKVPVDGGIISASASGYKSITLNVNGGATDVDMQLMPAPTVYVDIKTYTDSVLACSSQSALISALLRDCEGKAILNKQVKFTTTIGKFTESDSNTAILDVDETGFAQAHLQPGALGNAVITAEPHPKAEGDHSGQINVKFRGYEIVLTASNYYLTAAGSSCITAQVKDKDINIPDALIMLNTDHGVFQENGLRTYSTMTDSNGNIQATLLIDSPGTARVSATSVDSCANMTAAWLAVAYKTNPWSAQQVGYSNPLVVDLDDHPNEKKEVVVLTSNGYLTAIDPSGSIMWTYTMHAPGTNTPACAVVDTERSGKPCIFIPSENQQSVYAFANDGQILAGWPAGTNYRFEYCSAAIGDINLDGSLEIVAADYSCYVFSWNLTGDWKKTGTHNSSFLWRNIMETASTAVSGSSCALGDIDNDPDKILDVAVGSTYPMHAFVFPGDLWGDFMNTPVYTDGWWKPVVNGIETSPAIGDIDGDGKNDIAVCTKANLETSNKSYMYVWLSSNNSWNSHPVDSDSIYSSPALHDLDGDNKLDIIFGSDSGKVYAKNWLGQDLNGWENGIQLNLSEKYAVRSSPVVGDVTGDGEVDVVVGCGDGNVYAIYKDGVNHSQNGLQTGPIAWIKCCIPVNKSSAFVYTSPVISLNKDNTIEVIAAGSEGIYRFALGNAYSTDPSLYPWPTFHRDNQRTGCVTTPPQPVNASIQGIISKNSVPVSGVKVYIYYNEDDTNGDPIPVPKPHSSPSDAREFVLSVGGSNPNQPGSGAYIINQLEANKVYKIKTIDSSNVEQWFTDIEVTTGLKRFDIAL